MSSRAIPCLRHRCHACKRGRDTPAPSSVSSVVVGGMRETAHVLNGFLFAATPWLAAVGMALFLFPGPVQRWGLASLGSFERRRADSGVRRAAPLLTQLLVLPPRIRDRVGGHGLASEYVVRWWRARPLAGPFKFLRFVLLLYIVGHIDDVADWENLRWSADPGPHPGVMQTLLSSFVAMPTTVATWDSSTISRGSALLVTAMIMIAEVRLIKRMYLTSSGRGATVAAYDLEGLTGRADGTSVLMEDRRCWPAVALLTVAAQCATVLRRWEETQPDCQIPRVSVQPVERAIWRVHRTRRARALDEWAYARPYRSEVERREAVGLGSVGPGSLVCDPGRCQDIAPGAGAVAAAVVRQDALDGDARAGEVGVGPLPEAGRGFLALVGQDLAVGEAGVVVDGGVDVAVARRRTGLRGLLGDPGPCGRRRRGGCRAS